MPPPRARLVHGDIGAWVFKANPQVAGCAYFSGADGIERPRGVPDPSGWTLAGTYRTGLVEPGDRMVLWVTGAKDPGIHEIGRVTARARRLEHGPGSGGDAGPVHRWPYVADYTSVLLTEPVPRSDLRADPVLRHCEQLRVPVVSNPTYLTPAEAAALAALLREDDLRAAGWDPRAEQLGR